MRNRWIKIFFFTALPVVLFLFMAERLSWRPRTVGIHRYGAHTVTSMVFSPDANLLASASYSEIKLWDIRTRELKRTLRDNQFVFSLSFSPDGKVLATAGRVVHLWDVQMGKLLRT